MKTWGNLAGPIFATALTAAILGGGVLVMLDEKTGKVMFGIVA